MGKMMIENEFKTYVLHGNTISRRDGTDFVKVFQFEDRSIAQSVVDELNRAVQYGEGMLIRKFKTMMGLP